MKGFGAGLAALVGALSRRRVLSLAGFAALAALLAWAGSGLQLDEDLLAFLPKDEPRIKEHARVFRAFKALDTMRIDLGPEDDLDRLVAAAEAFERTLLARDAAPLVSRVFAGVSAGRASEVAVHLLELAGRSLPSLVPAEEVAAIVSRHSTDDALDERLARDFETLNSFEGQGAQAVIRRDPIGLEGPFFSRVQELQAVARGARLERGHVVSSDGKHVLFLVEPAVPASKTEEGEKVLALVERAEKAAQLAAPGIRAVVLGGHRASIENARAIKKDAWLTSLVSLAAMFVVYAAIFPRRWMIPLTALPLAFGGAFGTAACALCLGKMSKIAVGFGGILLGLADDFIVHLYYFYELRARDGHPEPAVSAVERIAFPSVAAGASIAAAFIALAASGFPGQRDLAFFAAASLAGTLAFCLVAQPLLLPSCKPARPLRRAGAPLKHLVEAIERREKPVLLLALVATLLLGAAATRIRFEDDPRAIDARSAATKADEDEVGERWGDPSSIALVVARGTTLEAALEQNDRAYAALSRARGQGLVQAVSSIAPLVPSARTQETRRAAWRALFTEEARRSLAERLRRMGPRHRFSAQAFEPFFERLASGGEPVDPSSTLATLPEILGPHVARDQEGFLVATFVALEAPEELSWAASVEEESGAVVATGRGFARALVSLIRERLATCGALAFVVVLAVLVAALGKPRHVLAAALPLGVGLVWSAGIFALAGTTINAINFLIPVLTFGLSVDYVLFLASGYLRPVSAPDEVEQAQGAVVASSVTTLAGMASLLLAKHPAIWSVGVVSLVGTTCSLLAIFLITPALLRKR